MSKIKFEKAMLLIEGEFINQLSWWPEWFPPVNLAVLQAPLKDSDTTAWQAAIESAVKTGELASTLKPYLFRPPVFDLTKEFSEQGIPCDQDTITATDFAAWLTAQGEKPSEHIAAWFTAVGAQAGTVNAMTTAKPAPVAASEWEMQAQTRAREIVKESRARDVYPSQINLGDQIASEFRKAGITGADGKPLTGATIKRHALKGISSATGKQLSTTIGRGK